MHYICYIFPEQPCRAGPGDYLITLEGSDFPYRSNRIELRACAAKVVQSLQWCAAH